MMETFASSCRRRRLTAGDEGRRIQLPAGEMLRRKHGLGYQHLKAASRGHTAVLGPQQQLGAEGIVHYIQHGFQCGKAFGSIRHCPDIREHPAGCRVDDDLHIAAVHGLTVQQRTVLTGAAGGQNFFCAAVAADRCDRRMRTACTQNQHGFIGKIHTVGLGQVSKARVVGVVTVQLAVPVHNGVHRHRWPLP